MKSPRIHPHRLTATGLMVITHAFCSHALQAAVTLNGTDAFVVSGTPTGDLSVAGDLSVVKGIDFGTTSASPALAAVQLNYFGGGENAAMFDLTAALGTIRWRDNLTATARNKMALDGGNLLTLYKSDGTSAGILLNPNTGQINLSGTGGGIYANGAPVFSIGPSGNLLFGSRPFNISATTSASSSTTGALTVAGGLGVAMDSYINELRVGRGGGNVATNTAYGVNALQVNTTGYANTASGYYALRTNTTGYSNTSTGTCALYTNTTGYSNTSTGACALYSNTAGSYNTAFGNYALRSNTMGYSNTSTGAYALGFNTYGSSNTAAGYYALYANTSGSSNTAVGSQSLYSNATGASNVAIGSSAGKYQATGNTSLTAPNNSIYIGANARGFSNLDRNSIVIGAAAVGEGANTTVIGNNSTLKTHLYGTVNASAFTINNAPVMTSCYGSDSVLSNGATLALGNGANATRQDAIAIGTYANASMNEAVALGTGAYASAQYATALANSYAAGESSLAAASGTALGFRAIGLGAIAYRDSGVAIGGFDEAQCVTNATYGKGATAIGGCLNVAVGNYSYAMGWNANSLGIHSYAMGYATLANSYATALGSCNLSTNHAQPSDGNDPWLEDSALFELGNGNPDFRAASNAITTLKNGQTTLTNKEWKAHADAPLADPASSTASGGEALVVEGHTRLKGKVIIEQAQGDISMGIYGP